MPVPAYEPQISTQSEPDYEKQKDKEVKKEETKKEEKKEETKKEEKKVEGKKEEAPAKKPDQTGRFDYILSRGMRFPTMWYVRPAKAQTSLHICAD